MTAWAEDIPAGEPEAEARQDRPGRALLTVIAAIGTAIRTRTEAAWPRIVRAGRWVTEAVVGVFVGIGWTLGFAVLCLKGVVYGFCSGAGISQPAEWAARRQQARQAPPGPGAGREPRP